MMHFLVDSAKMFPKLREGRVQHRFVVVDLHKARVRSVVKVLVKQSDGFPTEVSCDPIVLFCAFLLILTSTLGVSSLTFPSCLKEEVFNYRVS